MLSKKVIFFVSLIGTIILTGVIFIPNVDYCFSHNWCNQIWDWVGLLGPIIFVFPVIFFLSLITYNMQEEVFKHWIKFAIWYIPIFILFTIWISSSMHGGDFSGVIAGGFEVLLSLLLLVLFFLISLIRIISKYHFLKKR